MLGAGTLGRPNRDDMGRVVGEGFRVGNSCTPVADSCQCMAKPIQYCKGNRETMLSTKPALRKYLLPRPFQLRCNREGIS